MTYVTDSINRNIAHPLFWFTGNSCIANRRDHHFADAQEKIKVRLSRVILPEYFFLRPGR